MYNVEVLNALDSVDGVIDAEDKTSAFLTQSAGTISAVPVDNPVQLPAEMMDKSNNLADHYLLDGFDATTGGKAAQDLAMPVMGQHIHAFNLTTTIMKTELASDEESDHCWVDSALLLIGTVIEIDFCRHDLTTKELTTFFVCIGKQRFSDTPKPYDCWCLPV